jgi:trans-aconitate methyltransferase
MKHRGRAPDNPEEDTTMIIDQTKKDVWKAEYERSPVLRAEFLSAENYAAYMAADAKGLIRVLHS